MTRHLLSWLCLAAACTDGGTLRVKDAPPAPEPTFDALAEQAGFVVQEGTLHFMEQADCCVPGANCFGSNASTPYGSYALPPAPDQAVASPAAQPSHELFLLRPDEAVVFLGQVPPPARYFSFRTYLWRRAATDLPVFGSLGPTVNHLSVAGALGQPAWDEPLAIVTTADAAIESQVISLLVEAGWDPASIATDRLPLGDAAIGLHPGVDAESDEYTTIVRVAVSDDPERQVAWQGAPGRLLRVSPKVAQAPQQPHAFEAFPTEERGASEPLDGALADLEAAVHRAYPSYFRTPRASEDSSFVSPGCLSTGACFGGTMDAAYRVLPPTRLLAGQFLVVYGVNHEHTGRASYSSFSIDQGENWYGVLAVDSRELVGSAQTFADATFRARHPNVDLDDLWAWVVARDCSDPIHAGHPCTEIATTCPGVAFDQNLLTGFRAYLDPVTGTRPSPEELVHPGGTLFFKLAP
jgi:hypothetical protein